MRAAVRYKQYSLVEYLLEEQVGARETACGEEPALEFDELTALVKRGRRLRCVSRRFDFSVRLFLSTAVTTRDDWPRRRWYQVVIRC